MKSQFRSVNSQKPHKLPKKEQTDTKLSPAHRYHGECYLWEMRQEMCTTHLFAKLSSRVTSKSRGPTITWKAPGPGGGIFWT